MSSQESEPFRGWEYDRLGDYHRDLDPNWSYTPTYLRKMSIVKDLIQGMPPALRILDIGAGEGVLVEELISEGREAVGLDLNYESEVVQHGDARALPFPDASFGCVVMLDTLEHLAYADQPTSLNEIRRVLTSDGKLVLSVPNLAHLSSRFRFFLRGNLDRTDIELNHIGERPIVENRRLLAEAGFTLRLEVGVTLTLPLFYRRVFCRNPAKYAQIQNFLEPIAARFPALAMFTVFLATKQAHV